MPENILLKGLLLGFSIAAPVGPIGILCIQQSLNHGRIYGLVAGLGAATADAFYGLVAAFGLTIIINFFTQQTVLFRLVGGLFLCYLGIKTFLKTTGAYTGAPQPERLPNLYFSTFLLTLTNPMTILSFALIFAGLGASVAGNGYGQSVRLVLGVFLGSALWWFLLSLGVSLFRQRINAPVLRWVNRGAGVIIVTFGVVILVNMIRGI